jgi:hypothetical protein
VLDTDPPTSSSAIITVCHHGATVPPALLCGEGVASVGTSCIWSPLSVIFLWILKAASRIKLVKGSKWTKL